MCFFSLVTLMLVNHLKAKNDHKLMSNKGFGLLKPQWYHYLNMMMITIQL